MIETDDRESVPAPSGSGGARRCGERDGGHVGILILMTEHLFEDGICSNHPGLRAVPVILIEVFCEAECVKIGGGAFAPRPGFERGLAELHEMEADEVRWDVFSRGEVVLRVAQCRGAVQGLLLRD